MKIVKYNSYSYRLFYFQFQSVDRLERDRLVIFLHKLILHRRNVRDVLEWNGVRILVDLMTLAHLHTARATVPAQSNVLEAAPNSGQSSSDKEWYYNVEKGQGQVERTGPVSFQDVNIYCIFFNLLMIKY